MLITTKEKAAENMVIKVYPVADLVILDYQPRMPLTPQNLGHHLTAAITARDVESVMIDGCWRLWARQPLKFDGPQLAAKAHAVASQLWDTMAQL